MPVLHHPNTEIPFVLEVDASNSGVRVVLSQRFPVNQKLHPCAFFSRRLTPAHSVGNKEQLEIIMALQEWRHWLEGTKEPFTVCTDYKNFAYTRTVKTLNSRQAVPISTSTMVPHLNGLHDWCAILTRQVRNTYHCWPFLQVHSFYPLSKFSSVLKTASLAHLTTFSTSMGSCWTKSQTGGPNLFVHSFQVHISGV